MQAINVGIIGSGFMGGAHIDSLRRVPGVNVIAISSIDLPRAEELADHFAVPDVYPEWHDLANNPNIHAVHNCTPNDLHFEVNKALLEAGKHVLSEKPLTLTSKQSGELVRLARSKGLVTAMNFNYRGYPLVQHARALIARGDIGPVHLVHGHYLQDWLLYDTDYNWRLESKISGESRAIADIGSHWFDLIQFVTGAKIQRVFAHLYRLHDHRKRPKFAVETFQGKELGTIQDYDDVEIDTEDAGFIILQFDNGMRGNVVISQVSPGRKNRQWFEIDGQRASLSWNQEEPNSLWIGYRDKPNELLIKDPSLLDPEARPYAHYPGGHPEGYPDGPRNLFRNFYRYIREGKQPGTDPQNFPTFADGDWEVRIVEAVLRSSREEKWVELKNGD